jgi:hypothetical protein
MNASPEDMRSAMAGYVNAALQAYVDASAILPPAEQARLPLMSASGITIAAVGTRYLHVIGTTESLPEPTQHEVAIHDQTGPLSWQLRFFDPTIIPALGLIDESTAPDVGQVRDLLGIRTHLFHLSIPPGSGLDAHHAQHAGTGLAHTHAAAERDFTNLQHMLAHQESLVREMRGAFVAGLPRAHALIAAQLSDDPSVVMWLTDPDPDFAAVRRSLLNAVRVEP